MRKALVRVHEQTLGKYLFDGTLLYNVRQLAQVEIKLLNLISSGL